MTQVEVCTETELRKLRPAELYTLGQILTIADSWKKLMAIVPQESCANLPKFNAEHFSLIEQAAQQQRRSAAEIFLDEWSTMGRRRPTLRSLLDLLVQAELFRAADYVAGDILKGELPKRPERGPAAAVDISDEALEKLLEENSSPDTDSSVIHSEISTEQFLYCPEELLDDAGGNNRSTKLASEETYTEKQSPTRQDHADDISGIAQGLSPKKGTCQNSPNLPGNLPGICGDSRPRFEKEKPQDFYNAGPSFAANPLNIYRENSQNCNPAYPVIRVQFQRENPSLPAGKSPNLNYPNLPLANSPNFNRNLAEAYPPNLDVSNSPNLNSNSPKFGPNSPNFNIRNSPHFLPNLPPNFLPNFNSNPRTAYLDNFLSGTTANPQILPSTGAKINNADAAIVRQANQEPIAQKLPVSDLIKFSHSVESLGNHEPYRADPVAVPYSECKTEFLPVTILEKRELPTEELPVCLNREIFAHDGTSSDLRSSPLSVRNILVFPDTSTIDYSKDTTSSTSAYSNNIAGTHGTVTHGDPVNNIAPSATCDNTDHSTNPTLPYSDKINSNSYGFTGSSGDVIIDIERSDSSITSSIGSNVNDEDRRNNSSSNNNCSRQIGNGINEMNSLELPVCVAELSSRFDSFLAVGQSKTDDPEGRVGKRGLGEFLSFPETASLSSTEATREIVLQETILDSTELPVTVLEYENV